MSADLWSVLALIALPAWAGAATAQGRLVSRGAVLIATALVVFGLIKWRLTLLTLCALLVTVPFAVTLFVLGGLAGQRLTLAPRTRGISLAVLLLGTALIPVEVGERTEAVTSAIRISAAALPTWDALKSFGALTEKRTGLLAWGLPVPVRCTLDGEALMARRTCHFDHGRIEQQIVGWDPPRRMELLILSVDLPFHPFELVRASYLLTEQGGQTEVVRTTTFRSRQAPSWFFAPLEKMTVAAEHDYLLSDLAHRFDAGLARMMPPI